MYGEMFIYTAEVMQPSSPCSKLSTYLQVDQIFPVPRHLLVGASKKKKESLVLQQTPVLDIY